MTNYETYIPTKKERSRYFALFFAGAIVLGFLFFNNIIACVLLAVLAFPAEKYYKRLLAQNRKAELGNEFKDMLTSLSASFQTGRQMAEALREARDNLLLIFPPNAPINVELSQMVRRLDSGGESEKDVLFDFANRSGCEDARNFADVYYTCLTTGGDVIKVVNRTAEVLIEKMAIKREMETLMAQKKYEAKILTVVPILIIVFLRLNSPEYLTPLYTTIPGIFVMAGALAALAASLVWSNKIMSIEV